jgi:hypothetical protein
MTGDLDGLGSLAAEQLARAARDPRLERDGRAMVADFFDYLEEADMQRFLAIGALSEMQRSVERLEADMGVTVTDPDLTSSQRAEFQAAHERAQLAHAQELQEYAHLNGLTLVGMLGNLDGFVEALLPATRDMTIDFVVRSAMERAEADHPEIFTADVPIEDDVLRAIETALAQVLRGQMPTLKRPFGGGVERWEQLLRAEGLGTPTNLALPPSLDAALDEASALRNVIVHRAGRIDEKALAECERLKTHLHMSVGQFVRITRVQYRRYSAAIRAYGMDVTRRVLARGGMEFPVDLDHWERYVLVNA